MKNEDVTWILANLESRLKSLSGKDFFKVKSFIADEFFPRLFEVQEFKTFYESKIITDFPAVLWTDSNFSSALDDFLRNLKNTHKQIDSTKERSEDFQMWVDKAKRDFGWNIGREEVKDYFDEIESKESPEKFQMLFEDFLSPLSKRSGSILVMSEETENTELSASETKEILETHRLRHKLYESTERFGEILAPKDFITIQYIKLYRFWCLDENVPARKNGNNCFYYWVYKFTEGEFDLAEIVEFAENILYDVRKNFGLFPLELKNGRLYFANKNILLTPDSISICKVYLEFKPSEKIPQSHFFNQIYGDDNLNRFDSCKKQINRLNKDIRENFEIESPFHFGSKIYRSL